jgi:hypothetical protein
MALSEHVTSALFLRFLAEISLVTMAYASTVLRVLAIVVLVRSFSPSSCSHCTAVYISLLLISILSVGYIYLELYGTPS